MLGLVIVVAMQASSCPCVETPARLNHASLRTRAVAEPVLQDTGSTSEDSLQVAWSGFVDAYYAWDSGHPSAFDRPYTTQAARSNEFNINLAHVGVSLVGPRVRGRVALQAGTSVQANYAGEPTTGSLSGPSLSRHIQEATAGARLADGLWLDGGIYFSYIGLEGWISRDNPTYTRSLVAEFSPYYLSGARLTWQPAHRPFTMQLHVMNGWQNIAENNGSKSVGLRVDWQASTALTVTYANFIGNEQPDTAPRQTRVFNQVMARLALANGALVQGQVDVGHQASKDWYGFTMVGRLPVSSSAALVARIERYSDPDQVIVATGTPNGFSANGASIGCDIKYAGGLVWRTELRGLRTSAPLFPQGSAPNASRTNLLVVSSLALTL